MPHALAFLASLVATGALLVVLGFSAFLCLLDVRAQGRAGPAQVLVRTRHDRHRR
jgi:hypothetical protein